MWLPSFVGFLSAFLPKYLDSPSPLSLSHTLLQIPPEPHKLLLRPHIMPLPFQTFPILPILQWTTTRAQVPSAGSSLFRWPPFLPSLFARRCITLLRNLC